MELEAKFRVSETEAIKRDVESEDFDVAAKKHQVDHYYIVGETDATETCHYFRMREDKHTGESSLDYHRVLSEFGTEETEVSIKRGADGRDLLAHLGHKVECVVDKQRTEYEHDAVVITIDHIGSLDDLWKSR